MPVGGRRPGAGRPVGSRNSYNRKLAERAALEGLTPLEYLLEVMRDISNPQATRLDAAKAAAPYVHPRLAQIENKLPAGTDAQIVFLGGVLANPGPMLEMARLEESVN